MQNLKSNLWNSDFSHIYIEKNAINHPNTIKILEHFKNSTVVKIDYYKEMFSRSNQSFRSQKQSRKLILAIKKDGLIYEGAEVCEDFGNEHFYYTSSMMNCIYDCEYCYLQGMYPSANIVVFVNIEDIFNEVEKLLKKHPVYLCISYDTDLLAFEGVTLFTTLWMEFAKNHPNLKLELRTKSANFDAIKDIKCLDNTILAWTISPDNVISKYEWKTPSLELRLKSIKQAIQKGWNVRICFDPLLYIRDWKKQYSLCVEHTFKELPYDKILDVSIGVFRVAKDYLKKMEKERIYSPILAYPFECTNGVCSYSKKHAEQMIDFVYKEVCKFIPKEKIYI
ncbi:radical SAM protein [Clostridium aestuarii]|uniref:Radical SAM protein n=1 Tax=Clostridium aestuarii TaxID=338193 RepID=A0ABT4D113_9CLOT|nr:radical SAM protein [Clostridium aestuarii]MCY6484935.1 radical SAM protein [Clostridium aestuarii]